MSQSPKIRIETREELIYLLAEAAAIEHNLMCCYLYAAWSLKRGERDGLTAEQAAAVKRWKPAITSVAVEEMTHLALASNLARRRSAPGRICRGRISRSRPATTRPASSSSCAGFSRGVLDHFIFLERPEGKELRDSAEFVHPADYHRTHAQGPADAERPGLRDGRPPLSRHPPRLRGARPSPRRAGAVLRRSRLADRPGRRRRCRASAIVTDLKSAEAAIETIIEQGEGAPGHSEDSHYNRFLTVRDEYDAFIAADPAFAPAFPVRAQPDHAAAARPAQPRPHQHAARRRRSSTSPIRSTATCCAAWCRPSGAAPSDDGGQAPLRRHRHRPDGAAAAGRRPSRHRCRPADPIPASMPASPSRCSATSPACRAGPGEKRMMAERVAEIAKHARRLFPAGHELAGTSPTRSTSIAAQPRHRGRCKTVGRAITRCRRPRRRPTTCRPGGEHCRDRRGRRHRHPLRRQALHPCALLRARRAGRVQGQHAGRPGSSPTRWTTEALVRVAHECPSGAITYHRKDGGRRKRRRRSISSTSARTAPMPSAAPLTVDGEDIGFRATLCRCGASKNKPFCDGSHNDARLHRDRRAGDARLAAARRPRRPARDRAAEGRAAAGHRQSRDLLAAPGAPSTG